MSTRPTYSLHMFPAREAPRILVVRRGPSRVFHLAMWDTEADTFEHGSWFRGKLYLRRCDLSWDGRLFAYFAMGPTREHYSWVAVSRPPWVRAELFFPKDDTWHGGGVFTGPRALWLNLPAGARARAGDADPQALGVELSYGLSEYGEDEGPLYRRLERDGWRRDDPPGQALTRRTAAGWMHTGGPEWVLQPRPDLPRLRLIYRGYYHGRGRVFAYRLDGAPDLLGDDVSWAGYDTAGRLVVGRLGATIERYTAGDVARGAPSFRHDLSGLEMPPAPPPRPRPPAEPAPPPQPGPDERGRYHYLGEPARRRAAEGRAGHAVRSQEDLRAAAGLLRAGRAWPYERPLAYAVAEDGALLLGLELAEDVDVASGRPVLAAGEVVLEEQPDGSWAAAMVNNRSYGYMPGPESWPAVARALDSAGVPRPDGFSELYPREGTWEDLLQVLRS